MLGVPDTAPTIMLVDNEAVLQNKTVPSSMLKKKNNAIAYHRVCESIAGGILSFFHIPSTENIVEILTKPLSRHLSHQIKEAILFSPRKASIPTPAALEPPNDLIPVAILCTRTNYESDTRLEAYDSDWEPAPSITDTAEDLHASDSLDQNGALPALVTTAT
jgi:hypothetical protein